MTPSTGVLGRLIQSLSTRTEGKMRPHWRYLTAALAATVGLPLVFVGASASPAAASPKPITIAYITDLTGPGGSENGTSPAGFDARIAEQNAEGGVHGRSEERRVGKECRSRWSPY